MGVFTCVFSYDGLFARVLGKSGEEGFWFKDE